MFVCIIFQYFIHKLQKILVLIRITQRRNDSFRMQICSEDSLEMRRLSVMMVMTPVVTLTLVLIRYTKY